MKTKAFQMASGESYSILLGEDGMPLPYYNLFACITGINLKQVTPAIVFLSTFAFWKKFVSLKKLT